MNLMLNEEAIRLLKFLACPIANRLGSLSRGMMAPFSGKDLIRTYSVLKSAVDEDLLSGPDLLVAKRLLSFFSKVYPRCCQEP
jgi:hypothetical protein